MDDGKGGVFAPLMTSSIEGRDCLLEVISGSSDVLRDSTGVIMPGMLVLEPACWC